MSAAVPHCDKCDLDRIFLRIAAFANERNYGALWRCAHCEGEILDICPIGPLVPTPETCLNCGISFPDRGDFAECPGCGLSRLGARDIFGLDDAPADPIDLATRLFDLGLARRALATINSALLGTPALEKGWMIKYSFLCGLGFHNAALTVIEAAMDHIVNPHLIISYGCALQALGRDREALAAYREYLVTAPAGEFAGVALCNSANSLRKLDDHAGAEDQYRQAIAIEPTYSSHYANFIQMLFDLKRFDEAELIVEQAMAVARDDATIARLLEDQSAVCAENMRGYDALRFAQAAIDRGATGVRAIYLRGRALALLGRRDEARIAMRHVLNLDPHNADGLSAMKMLGEGVK